MIKANDISNKITINNFFKLDKEDVLIYAKQFVQSLNLLGSGVVKFDIEDKNITALPTVDFSSKSDFRQTVNDMVLIAGMNYAAFCTNLPKNNEEYTS